LIGFATPRVGTLGCAFPRIDGVVGAGVGVASGTVGFTLVVVSGWSVEEGVAVGGAVGESVAIGDGDGDSAKAGDVGPARNNPRASNGIRPGA